MRRLVVPGIVIVLAAAAFLATGGGGTSPAEAAGLETFPDCRALRDRLVATALEHVGPHGLEGLPVPMPFGVVEEVVADAASGGGDGAARSAMPGEADYTSATGTNVQVVGVDEPDHVKLTADTFVVIDGQRVALFDVADEQPRPVGRLDLPEEWSPFTMLAAGDRLVVFAHHNQPIEPMPLPREEEGVASDAVAPGHWAPPATVVVLVDVADPSAPRIIDHLEVAASFVSARLTGGRVLLVTNGAPTIPFVFPSGGPGADAAAEDANRAAVRASTIEQWLPTATSADGTTRVLADCEQVGVPEDVIAWQSVNMASFDPARDLRDVAAAATFGAGDMVYAATDRVYVAGSWWGRDGGSQQTFIHAFTADARPAYLASGEVEGQLLNQFALDRYEDHLRVAATVTDQARGDTDSRVVVLAERPHGLVEVGKVTGLGRPGETIRGIRYVGPVGYVVTFEQTDPLYTVALDDPRRPRVLGELKIPGYSAYLHPLSADRVLGVGSAAEDDGRITGLQLSLFDVSDLSAPTRLAVLELPGASTAVEWDHHAFTWVPDAGVAAMPVESWGASPAFGDREAGTHAAGLLLVRVTEGRLATVAVVEAPSTNDWSPGFSRAVAHDGTLLAVGPDVLWRVGFDGDVLAETGLR